MNPNDMAAFIALVVVLGVVALVGIIAWSRRRKGVGSAELSAINERLARMEQAIDAMAVETERISEGQRFTAKLLNERAGQPAKRE
jgi:hypothetical protein